jgi:hypothetical protein
MGALPPESQQAFAQPQDSRREASGLRKVMWFGVLQLVGLAVGGAFGIYIIESAITSVAAVVPTINQTYPATTVPPVNESSRALAALGPVFQGFLFLVPVIVVIDLAALALLTLGLRDMGKVDRVRFSTPSTFMLVMVAGTFISAAGALLLLSNLSSFFTAELASQGPPPSADALARVGSLFLGIVVDAVGGILEVVGLIGGVMLGLWRLGSRYDETTLKIAAIFMIIPLLNIIAPILVIIGSAGARGRLAPKM